MRLFTLTEGDSPLILSMPHGGTDVPDEIAPALNARGRELADTDWHIRELYSFAARFQPSIIEAHVSRYVIDLNRNPSGGSLYPGQATTDLVPVATFDGEPIWAIPPDAAEIRRRVTAYFEPYHAALTAEIDRIRTRFGYCVLYDCHSIRSVVPRLFAGDLPLLNLGTYGGLSARPAIEAVAAHVLQASGMSIAINGRFQGGWITRHYGRPDDEVHALQMEIAMRGYLASETPPWPYSAEIARRLQTTLGNLIEAILVTAASRRRNA